MYIRMMPDTSTQEYGKRARGSRNSRSWMGAQAGRGNQQPVCLVGPALVGDSEPPLLAMNPHPCCHYLRHFRSSRVPRWNSHTKLLTVTFGHCGSMKIVSTYGVQSASKRACFLRICSTIESVLA